MAHCKKSNIRTGIKTMAVFVPALFFFSCSEIYDRQGQLDKDLKDIENYIGHTSLTPSWDLVKTENAPAGSVPLGDTIKKQSNNIFFLNLKQGGGNQIKSSETALIAYKAYVLGGGEPYEESVDYPQGQAVALNYATEGVKYGVSLMKGAVINEDNTYTGPGEAYIIIPSTMAYQYNVYKNLPKNSILIFRVSAYESRQASN